MEDILVSTNAEEIVKSTWEALKTNLGTRHAYLTTIYPEVHLRIVAILREKIPPPIKNPEVEVITATTDEIVGIIKSQISLHHMPNFIDLFEKTGLEFAQRESDDALSRGG